MNKQETDKLAVAALRELADQIEADEIEVDKLVHEIGVKVTPVPGETFDKKEPAGDETWTLKVYRKSRPRANQFHV